MCFFASWQAIATLAVLAAASPSAAVPTPGGAWPTLVVVPASLRLLWAEALERWLPEEITPRDVHKKNKKNKKKHIFSVSS